MKDLSTLSDTQLVRATRTGDRNAYAVLWQRHSRAAMTVARSFTSLDAEDVVAEAFTLVFTATRRGGGPTAGFRPYLFTTVRNVAAGWGRAERSVPADNLDDYADEEAEQETLDALDKSLTASAFKALPTRWQEVLWYMDVESMTPRQVGPLLGMKPNAVSALAIRAREGLRLAWIKAHLGAASSDPECRRTIERLPAWSRGTLPAAHREQVDTHLAGCSHCQIVATEASTVNRRLALILLPLAAGLAGATAYLAAGPASSVTAATLPAEPPAWASPQPVAAGGALPVGMIVGVAATATAVLVAGGLVAALTLGQSAVDAGAAGGASVSAGAAPAPTRTETADDPEAVPTVGPTADPAPEPSTPPASAPEPGPVPDAPSPIAVVAPIGSPAPPVPVDPLPPVPPVVDPPAVDPPAPPGVAAPTLQVVDRPTTLLPAVAGIARPGAVVVVTDGSATWSTTADPTGAWAVQLSGIRPGSTVLTATQTTATDAGTDAGTVTSAPSAPVTVTLEPSPTGLVTVIATGSLYSISADGIPGRSFHFTIPSAGFTSAELTFDPAGHWEPDGPVYLPGTDVFFSYLSGGEEGPRGPAGIAP